MEYIKWIEYKNKKILFCNFSNLSESQYLDGVEEMEKELLTLNKGTKHLLLLDITNSYMTETTTARGKKTVEKLTKSDFQTITAMFGIKGLKRLIA